MELSIKCASCGATNKFDEKSIPTFCSFCGAALPDMRSHVDEAIRISQERERQKIRMKEEGQRHKMRMEEEEKNIHKLRLSNISDIFDNIVSIFALVVVFAVFFGIIWLVMSLRH